jgi:hypothetical protein
MQDMTFEEWKAKVDQLLVSQLGLGLDDMRDRNTRDAYEDEVSPEDFVQEEWGDDPEDMMFEELFG